MEIFEVLVILHPFQLYCTHFSYTTLKFPSYSILQYIDKLTENGIR